MTSINRLIESLPAFGTRDLRREKKFFMTLDKAKLDLTISVSLPSWVRSPVTTAVDEGFGRRSTVARMVCPDLGIIRMPSTPDFQGASASSIPGGRR